MIYRTGKSDSEEEPNMSVQQKWNGPIGRFPILDSQNIFLNLKFCILFDLYRPIKINFIEFNLFVLLRAMY